MKTANLIKKWVPPLFSANILCLLTKYEINGTSKIPMSKVFSDLGNRKFKTPNTKVNTLEKKIPNATTLIYINQYNTDKQNLEKKKLKKDVDKKVPHTSDLVTATNLNTKISEVENKIPDNSKYITQEFNKLPA